MRPQTHMIMVALAISFATALSLAVALVCISYLKDEPLDLPETEDTAENVLPPFEDTTDLLTAPEETTAEPELPDLSNGLRFSANGDGTCRLVSIGNCTDACVVIPEFSPAGDRVVEIADRAFFGSSTATAIQIPASVRLIGDLAFADCKNLVYISVSLQNPTYCDVDGILYTSDERTLILYPPKRAGNEVTIRGVTVEISDMAFYNCAYLDRVIFTGSAEQWENIRIGIKNYSLTAASKTFGDM